MLRIGSAEGFYGDDVTRALPMIEGGLVDVVCFEALSELTLAILRRDMLRDPQRGFTRDIATIAEKILPAAFARKIPLITNGGGLNPAGAAAVVRAAAEKQGLHGLRIAIVIGDDILPRLRDLAAGGHRFTHIETGEPLALDGPPLVTANAYLGAFPIADALAQGADIIITGRVADPCLYLAPLIHHYGWGAEEWDKLASGIICGHLLECTGQVVGGNSLTSLDMPTISPSPSAEGEGAGGWGQALAHLGYPIAEVEADGSFTLTKVLNTAGYVTLQTVKEQLLYEMHNPAAYITPDVVADITTLHLTEDGADRVQVTGVTGHPRTETLKVNLARMEGYSRELYFTLSWPRAWQKAAQLQSMLIEAWRGLPITRIHIDHPGVDSLFGAFASPPPDPIELMVRVVVTADQPDTLKVAVRRAMALGLSCPAGMSVTGQSVGDEPHVLLGLWPALLDRTQVTATVTVQEVK